jgi:peptide/nickel transport system permease protein
MESSKRRTRYVLKRLFQAIPIIFAIVVLNFFLLQ